MAFGIANRRFDGVLSVRLLTREGQQNYRAKKFLERNYKAQEDESTRVRWKSMLTLTLDPKKVDITSSGTEDSIRKTYHSHLMMTWKRFRARMWKGENDKKGRLRQYPFRYIAVVEWHKSGVPHLHILIDRFLPASIVRSYWSAAGGGVQIDFSYIANAYNSRKALLYVLKYVTKSLGESEKGCRRWMASNGVLPKQEPKDITGEYVAVTRQEVSKMNECEPVLLIGDLDGTEMVICRGQLTALDAEVFDGLVNYIDHMVETDGGGCNAR